ncbi:MAG: VacB/RNase II family 3'-5' exoribonuclease, partial [Planctomycetales bacterium]|nr:VacB/RNase II family 3'-5' exoribonuclease [Planctomycetales bacterium]
ARERLVGTVRRIGGREVLDAPGMPRGQEPSLDRAAPGGPEPAAGQRVVARIVEGPADGRPARVVVERVIGAETDPAADAEAVLEEFRIRREYPEEGVAEAARARAPAAGAPVEAGRRDCRDLLICTIDPADAKDFDDAVSLERRREGPEGASSGWTLGVHIADVAHEVRPGSPLDREAKLRGNTVYLMDRVVHMLPPALAADVCSLRPREDRNTFTAFLDLDEGGRTVSARLEKTLIRSARRFTYEEVQEILDGGGEADLPLAATLREMGALSARMRERRIAEGALDLDLPEAVVDLDPRGAPTGVRVKRRLAAHQLVEEFMLAANRAVAREMLRRRVPYVARVHSDPDEDSLERLAELCSVMSYRMEPPYDRRALQRVIAQALAPARRKTNGDVMLSSVLRSLKKAEYAPREEGHYALGWEHYTHFTSPIRRYADLRVHQLLTASIAGELDAPGARDRLAGDLVEACGLASEREVRAEEAERELTKLKVLRLLAGKLGETYPGTVVALAEYGIFIEVKGYFVEGLVRIEDLGDDRWKFSSNGFALFGERSRRKFQIGDPVRVRIESVDLTRRHLDLAVVGRG